MTRAMRGRHGRKVGGLIAGPLGLWLLSIGGCAGEPPKPMPTVTSDQVRTHADKAFDKLKQEEQQRAVNPTMP
jgi:hypothetical protein